MINARFVTGTTKNPITNINMLAYKMMSNIPQFYPRKAK